MGTWGQPQGIGDTRLTLRLLTMPGGMVNKNRSRLPVSKKLWKCLVYCHSSERWHMTLCRSAERVSVINEGTTMTTANEIADKIATEHGLTKVQAKTIVEAVFASITAAATTGAETSIPGFGKFKIKDTPEREARNPGTGATIKVAAARKLTFQPAKALKDTLNK